MGDGSLDGGAVSGTLSKSVMAKEWGWRLPLTSPRGLHARQHPRPSVGSPRGRQKQEGHRFDECCLHVLCHHAERKRRRLPSTGTAQPVPRTSPGGRLWTQRDWHLAQTVRQRPCVLSDETVNVAHETEAVSAVAFGFGE